MQKASPSLEKLDVRSLRMLKVLFDTPSVTDFRSSSVCGAYRRHPGLVVRVWNDSRDS